MNIKFKTIFVLIVFFSVAFLSLSAEPNQSTVNEKKIQSIVKKVYPSVVKVEARNGTRKVATGVVIDKKGYIVTTALISPRNEEFFITTSEGEKIEAEFLGMDSETHLALIRVKEKKLPPLELGKTEKLSAGSWIGVVSISPENSPAVTQGIISSIGKDRLRLNVCVVPGWSGSPVINDEGQMVGIVRGVYSDDFVLRLGDKKTGALGYVFSQLEAPSSSMAVAVPVDVVKDVFTEIKKKGKVERGWLGVSIRETKDGMVEIVDVEKESPAELAKLKRGDMILEFDGEKVINAQMLAGEIRSRKPGDDVIVKIERKEGVKKVKVKLGEYSEKDIFREFELRFPNLFPPEPPEPPQPPLTRYFYKGFENRKYIGVYLEELNRNLSEYFGVEEGNGLLVSKIVKNSPAEKAGLKVGDVIVRADGKRVEIVNELSNIIQDKEKGGFIEIEFLRKNKGRKVKVKIKEEKGRAYFISKKWNDYIDNFERHEKKLKEQSKKWEEMYYKNFQKNMKKLNEKIEKLSDKISEEFKKSDKEIQKNFELALKRYKYLRV